MPTQKLPLAQRVAEHYSVLLSASRDLNDISDELGKYISELDSALKKLNLGVAVWVRVAQIQNPGESSFEEEVLGYAKAGGRWGICLRKTAGDDTVDELDWQEELWLFNDAPRRFRIEAIDHIPELIEKLSTEAVKTTKELRDRLEDVKAVADAVKGVADGMPAKTNLELNVLRNSVMLALQQAGHTSASFLLSDSAWKLKEGVLRIEVPRIGAKMLALTFNPAAAQIVRNELKRLHGPSRFTLLPVDGADVNASAKEEGK